MEEILSVNKSKMKFAQLMDISEKKMALLCHRYYIVWLLRESYCFGDLSIENKQKCTELLTSLLSNNHRDLTSISNGIITNPDYLCSNWLYSLHIHFFNKSRFK